MKVVRQFSPDLIHVHFPAGQSLPVVGAHVLPHHWRLVVTVHNSDIRLAPFLEPRDRVWQSRLFERADAVTAVSCSLLEDAISLYPGISSKVRVISNGVGPIWFQRPEPQPKGEEKYVLFVGRLNQVKGVDLLLRAWKRIGSDFPETRLWLVGDGPDLESLKILAEELTTTTAVRFLGPKQQDELPHLYRSAEAVVLPSRREGLPLTLLEAGACGAITIGTKVPGIPEIIQDGVTGFLVDPESPHALAAAISRVLQLSPEEAGRIREAARETIRQQFSQERMISSYLDLFQSLLAKPPMS